MKVKILLKADFDGTRDAILSCLDSYHGDEVKLDVIEAAVGEITDGDVQHASAFQVRNNRSATTDTLPLPGGDIYPIRRAASVF